MKRKLIFFLFVSISASVSTQSLKVAVLDAVLAENVDKSVSIGVTEKISEEFVATGKYVVLDRTTVGQSLKEIEFQMSGLVSDAELKKAGEQLSSRLGASYVVVAQVSLISGTYFISAKMIDIKSGEITVQASDQGEGRASITLQIAQRVGKKLAAGKQSQPAVSPAQGASAVTAPTPESSSAQFEPRETAKWKPDQRNTISSRSTMNCGGSGLNLAQGFTPAMSFLALIDLFVQPRAGASEYPTEIKVHSGSCVGPVVGTATIQPPIVLEATWNGVVTLRFEFNPPIALTVGSLYVIEWVMPQENVFTWHHSGTNTYPGGTAYNCSGVSIPGDDFCFITWAPK